MRRARWAASVRRIALWAQVGLALLFGSACGKKRVEAPFQRPPATASAQPSDTPAKSPSDNGAATAAEGARDPDASESSSEEKSPEPAPQPRRRPRSASTSPPTPEPPPSPPPSPSLGVQEAEADGVRGKLKRASELLSLVEGIGLSTAQAEQAEAARAFVSQARAALEAGDVRRASVLAEKGLILVEDLAQSPP